MELFDKKYVYFMWDDILKDKECLLADDPYTLERKVNTGDSPSRIIQNKTGKFGNCEVFPFMHDIENSHTYSFAYYDPNYKLKIEYYLNHKQIQFLHSEDGWKDCIPLWDSNAEYRIKPDEPKYRPFKDAEELLHYWQLNYNPGAANRPQYSKPIIWIRKPEDDITYSTDYMITGIDKYTVFVEDMWIELKELFERGYTFLDDKPLGVKE